MDRAVLDFANLPFAYQKTDQNIRFWFRDGKWSAGELTADEHIPMHIAATCLHYGQEVFEGLKVYERPDGRIQTFRSIENAHRMQRSARKLWMEPVPDALFREAVHKVVRANRRFVPPYGSGASLYVRPLLIGTSAEVGVKPSQEYLFLVFVTPVGPYYKGGLTPVRLLVEEDIDRAAPGGVGDAKCGGNYAAGMRATLPVKEKGYAEVLYLDCREKKYLDESGSSNFYAIIGKSFATPASPSILPSITNMSVRQIAKDMGLAVEQRPVSVDELPTFNEAGCLGTAAVITPVEAITYRGKDFVYAKNGKAGPITAEMYKRLTAIQLGEAPDPYGWTEIVSEG
ncbi:MAG: branched-chain amino acid aminotransferase [candidate division NC10 bacterium]|nr:branched-chain amino acid aminotransferase [candidate division NC10 bacterium]